MGSCVEALSHPQGLSLTVESSSSSRDYSSPARPQLEPDETGPQKRSKPTTIVKDGHNKAAVVLVDRRQL
jgi:hypothetical protein